MLHFTLNVCVYGVVSLTCRIVLAQCHGQEAGAPSCFGR